jgi:hypothetical protein
MRRRRIPEPSPELARDLLARIEKWRDEESAHDARYRALGDSPGDAGRRVNSATLACLEGYLQYFAESDRKVSNG